MIYYLICNNHLIILKLEATVNYIKLKNILLKYYKNTRVCVEVRGILDTRIFIEKSRITINKHKLIISNENTDFTIDFLCMKKIKLKEKYRIEMVYTDFTVILEL